jgi:ribosome-associated protein
MIYISEHSAIPEQELSFHFYRSGGPGGQNVNKVSTAVELRFDIQETSALTGEIKKRLTAFSGKRLTQDGILLLTSQRFRTQERNRQDVLEKLVTLIRKAEEPPKKRIKTRPSKAVKQKRFREKQLLKTKKSLRQSVEPGD